MDITLLLDLFIKYGATLGPLFSFVVLASIMGYIQKENVKTREHSDKKFDQVLEAQDEMKSEYKQGFVKVYSELEVINRKINELDDKQKENNLLALRSIITNVSLPIDYRLASFDAYVEKGGNSWIHDYVQKEILGKKGEE